MTKTIGTQYYLEEIGKKPVLCNLFGHRWELSMSSGGRGSFDGDDNWVEPEEHRSYCCRNPRCEYRQHRFINYPDLSNEDKIAEIGGLYRTAEAMVWLLDGAE